MSKSEDCLFCKIIDGRIPSEKVYEDDTTYAFKDINPKAKVHVLIVPKDHYANVAELAAADPAELAHIVGLSQGIADKEFSGAYRLVFNTHLDAGDVIRHELVGRIVEAYDRHDATRVRRNRGKESREDAR